MARAALFLVFAIACSGATQTGSIGAVLARDDESGALHVREAPEGLAAAEAGMLAGDRIKMIDGILVDELDAPRIHRLLRGPVGTTVTVTVVRGDEVLHLAITRRELGAEPVREPETIDLTQDEATQDGDGDCAGGR